MPVKRGFEVFASYKRITMIEYDQILDGKDYSDRIDFEESVIANNTIIPSFDGLEAEHIKRENEFYKICAALDSEINRPAKTLTIREWYLQKDIFDEKYKKAS